MKAPNDARPSVVVCPVMRLPYMDLLCESLRARGWDVHYLPRLPRRGILLGRPHTAVHLHMLDHALGGTGRWARLAGLARLLLLWVPAMKLRGIRLVWTCHELSTHERSARLPALLDSRLVSLCADAVIVHSSGVAAEAVAKLWIRQGVPLHLLPHGDLAPHFARVEAAEGRRATLSASASSAGAPDTFTFASLGYMRRNKGTDLVVRAFRLLGDPRLRLLLAGDCEDAVFAAELQGLAAGDPRISFRPGRLDDAELLALHRQADLVVFAFRECPTSGSLLTALSLGRAVACPRVGHAREMESPDLGWFFDADETGEGLAAALAAASEDPAECRRRGRLARQAMAEQDWDGIASHLVRIYKPGTPAP